MARVQGLSLAATIRLVRGETAVDPRPNKALSVPTLASLYTGYIHRDAMLAIATHGITPEWVNPTPTQDTPARNHKSALSYPAALLRGIRAGQDAGQYLVVPDACLRLWAPVQCSPFGVVAKKDKDIAMDGRIIHDLSFPDGASTNSNTARESLPDVVWRSVTHVARRIHALRLRSGGLRVMGMAGDIKAAFRHLAVHADHARWFASHLPSARALVVDMSAPFGWTGSPIYYAVFGNGISHVVGNESPQSLNPSSSSDDERFFAYEWVDDHIMIELDRPGRLVAAETCLRLTMLLTLGPHAINDQRFTTWSTQLHALGLDWDLERGVVSMPGDKIAKALARVRALLGATRTTRLGLQRLLGSLRHVSSCLPAARAFFQSLHRVMVSAHRWGAFYITPGMRRDLEWFERILLHGSLVSVPVGLFAAITSHDLVVWVDASDDGLAAVDPVNRRFIRIVFDASEQLLVAQSHNLPELPTRPALRYAGTAAVPSAAPASPFAINVREFFAIVLASCLWAPRDTAPTRRFGISVFCDNTAGVAWSARLWSPNAYGQELARCLGLHMALYRFHVSTQHVAGTRNELADAGSRPRDPILTRTWSAVTAGWTESVVPPALRHVYRTFSTDYAPTLWPQAP